MEILEINEQPKPKLPPLKRDLRERKRRGGVIWAAVVCVIAALLLAGALFYGYPALQKHRDALARIPGLEKSMEAAGKRLDALDERLKAWDLDREAMSERLAGVEKKALAAVQAARKQAQEIAAETERRLQARLDARLGAMQTRLAALEAAQQAEQARLARLEQEFASARQEVNRQIAGVREDTGKDISALRGQLWEVGGSVDRNHRGLDALAHQIERERVDFEVPRGKSREVASGVSLYIADADPRYRRVSGWIWLMPDRRTLWLRDHGVQRPVTFYQQHESRPAELVITHVTKNSVAGYVLLPAGCAPARAAAGAGG